MIGWSRGKVRRSGHTIFLWTTMWKTEKEAEEVETFQCVNGKEEPSYTVDWFAVSVSLSLCKNGSQDTRSVRIQCVPFRKRSLEIHPSSLLPPEEIAQFQALKCISSPLPRLTIAPRSQRRQ